MKNFVKFLYTSPLLFATIFLLGSCKSGSNPTATNPGGISTATGLEYNADEGFQVLDFRGQPEGPNLVFIEGGRTVLGSYEEDVFNTHDNLERAVTVASFYMDEFLVTNQQLVFQL